jgi:uncharacterized damage-inducible protein DinB
MKPQEGTYPGFYHTYISKVAEDNVIRAMENNLDAVRKCIAGIAPQKEDYAYAEGKWTVKQLVNHLTDTERIFAYRALRFARRDEQMLASFEENDYAREADVSKRTLAGLLHEFDLVRQSSICLFKSFSEERLLLSGSTPAGRISVLALGFAISGHASHHLGVLKEKYL